MFTLIKRYPLAAFFALTYVFLILGWVAFQDQIAFGPLLAALIVVPIVSGRAGLKAWASQIVRWRVGLRWYVAALILPLIVTVVAAGLNILLGAATTPIDLSKLPELLPEAIFIFIFVGLGEEPGFRGFALSRLQTRHSAFVATLILGVLGVVWHIPLFLSGDSPWTNIPLIIVGYFVFTWLVNGSKGSVLIAMLFHTATAIIGPQIFATLFSGADLVNYTWLLTLGYGVVAAITLFTRDTFSTEPLEPLPTIAEPAPSPAPTR